ncbi:MAG: hypothetical protein EKK68_05880 [Candidatus Competibacteraceae bacterium]|nr:MAG: hypothetical protein EKK68_05880 [Candidatus Competibacteraceae bacterium]
MDRINSVVRAGPTLFPTTRQPRLAADRVASGPQPADSTVSQDAKTTAPAQETGSAASSQDAKTAALLSQLAQRDRQVRTHEAAHIAAGGMYVRGGARFSYTTGPDGQAYATGGEVSIDRSPVPNDPQATLQKLQQVQRAALAPADPSPQDRSVAAAAAVGMTQARIELAQHRLGVYQATENSAITRSSGFSVAA